jgi:hypothetical protein
MVNFKIYKSQRGGSKLSFGGYIYNYRTEHEGKKEWRCVIRKCAGTATTEFKECALKNLHNHTCDQMKAHLEILKSDIKERAISTSEKPKDILLNNLKNDNRHIINMPKVKNIVGGITRIRKKLGISYNHLLTSVPDALRKTFNSEKFLFLELDNTKDRKTLIFTTYCNLIHLENTDVCVCDGTFYACPSVFSQLYTIQGLVRGKGYPVVYCLMHTVRFTCL